MSRGLEFVLYKTILDIKSRVNLYAHKSILTKVINNYKILKRKNK